MGKGLGGAISEIWICRPMNRVQTPTGGYRRPAADVVTSSQPLSVSQAAIMITTYYNRMKHKHEKPELLDKWSKTSSTVQRATFQTSMKRHKETRNEGM